MPRKVVQQATHARTRVVDPAGRRYAIHGLSVLLLILSVMPVLNMASTQQVMNTSFDRLHLMNTYGAFGSIGRVRHEIVLEGAQDEVLDPLTEWKEYEFHGKPGDPDRRPAWFAPYQHRIDWQIWFAAMQRPDDNPWLIHFIDKLLKNDAGALSLLKTNPFPKSPPRFIRASYYRYEFTTRAERKASGRWWNRTRLGDYLPVLSLDRPALQRYLRSYGWGDSLGKP